ncbi:hypothetical protein [Actinomadura sp. GTD37]|uniref:hypothetical protein n=1 Tax=Actinomadura sp. GTD37 TaxID=1778030 RepID=UPI0035BF85CC
MTTPQPEQQTLQGGVILGKGQPADQPPPSHIRLAPDTPDTPTPDPEGDAHEIQAMTAGITLVDRVECLGGHYRIKDKVGLMPLMRFAHVSKKVDEDEMEALVCIYDMLKACIHPVDWDRFVEDMTEKDADVEELMPVVARTIEMLAARPTQQSSDSSPGDSTTGPGSTRTSSSVDLPAGPRVPDWARETVPVAAAGARRA